MGKNLKDLFHRKGMLLKRGMGNGEWDDSGEWEIKMGI